MGYSARYHAASLAAVFLAFGVGILIGVGFGDTVVSGTQKNLERSLTGDLGDARKAADDLRVDLRRRRGFEREVYAPLVAGRLRHRRLGLVGIGGVPEGLLRELRSALQPSGARLAALSVVRPRLDLKDLDDALARTRFAGLARHDGRLSDLAETVGVEMVKGGRLLEHVRNRVLSRSSGARGRVDGIVLVRQWPDDLDRDQRAALDRFERGVVKGIRETDVPVVGVERSDADPSGIGFFAGRQISTVDSIDLTSGQVALVFALAGAEGAFGIKDSADQLLPDPLAP